MARPDRLRAAGPRPAQPQPHPCPDTAPGRDARCRRGGDRVGTGRLRHGRDARRRRQAGARPRAGGDDRRGGVRRPGARRPGRAVPGPRPRGDERSVDLDPCRERGRRRIRHQLGLLAASPRRGARRVAGGRHRGRPGRALRGDRGRHRRHVRRESAQRPQRPARRGPGRDGPPVAGHPAQRPRLRRLRAVCRRLPERREAVRAPAIARGGVRARGRGPGSDGGPAHPGRERAGNRRRRARSRRRDHGPRPNGGPRGGLDPLAGRPAAVRDRPGRRRPDPAHPPGRRGLRHLRGADGALVGRPAERDVRRLRGGRGRVGLPHRGRPDAPRAHRERLPVVGQRRAPRGHGARGPDRVLPGDRARPRHRTRGRRTRRDRDRPLRARAAGPGAAPARRPSSWRGSTGRPVRNGSCRS